MSLSSRLDKLEARGDASAGRDGIVLILPVKDDSGCPEGSVVVIRPGLPEALKAGIVAMVKAASG